MSGIIVYLVVVVCFPADPCVKITLDPPMPIEQCLRLETSVMNSKGEYAASVCKVEGKDA